MKFYIFASGSKGNATLIIDNKVNILIDLGISKHQLEENLKRINLSIRDINFILVTHEHTDHTKGLGCIHNIPIYGGKNSYKCSNYKELIPYQSFKYKHLEILPIEVSHDAYTPLGYIIKNNTEKLVYITDTGYINEKNMKLAKNATYYIIESNHNRKMLLKTHRPLALKERTMSEFGHLNNEDCAMYLSAMIGKNTKQIFLAHISEEANDYDLALSSCITYLNKKKINTKNLLIKVAYQTKSVEGGYED